MASTSNSTQATKANSKANVADDTLITEKAAETLHHAIDNLAARLSATETSLRSGASNSADVIAEKQKAMETKWQGSSVGQYVTKHPVASAGIAFLAGLAISSLVKKSD